MNKKIGVIIGSLRENSFTSQIANALIKLFPSDVETEIIKIGDLPLYNEDLENNVPAEWTRFRKKAAEMDGFLFVTPEYNRSMPASIKNALDVGSRPSSEDVWGAKPSAVVSSSPGAISGFGAHHHLRQVLVGLNVPVATDPQAYIGSVMNLFDDKGQVKSKDTTDFFQLIVDNYLDWLKRLS